MEELRADAVDLLMAYDGPRNIRELRDVLERGAITARGPIMNATDLEFPSPPPVSHNSKNIEHLDRQPLPLRGPLQPTCAR